MHSTNEKDIESSRETKTKSVIFVAFYIIMYHNVVPKGRNSFRKIKNLVPYGITTTIFDLYWRGFRSIILYNSNCDLHTWQI